MTSRPNWLIGALACVLFLLLGSVLDSQPTEAQDVADDAEAALSWADLEVRRDALAKQICEAELGPGTTVLWTGDGDLVCRPAQPRVAQGGAL
ncbi:MAG: hypothetical protein U1C04_18755 [Hydrogenophaga sp.]|uniref:hypothetical protein n=1 Tax=Hydrogenophaga sp. TaxID=1904254 RepID=UPI002AB87E44|nr:hypothetical protein [Hydrogenophaga sp.]MDZ4282791.1 hypothetical protein [Hydrogenophaga sp.]